VIPTSSKPSRFASALISCVKVIPIIYLDHVTSIIENLMMGMSGGHLRATHSYPWVTQ
jgi:hypothetical protein